MSVHAAIDVGSNSMKLFVGAVVDGRVRPLHDDLAITRLGEGLAATGRLSDAALARNLDQLERFVAAARARGADPIAVVGTMALRRAANAADFVTAAMDRCAVDVEILPGEEEARLAWVAALSGLGPLGGPGLVFDTGGGSTELIFGRGTTLLDRHSLDVGVRRPTETHLRGDPPAPGEVAALRAAVAAELAGPWPPVEAVVGLGGTVTTLAAVELGMTAYEPERLQGHRLAVAEVERQIALYSSLSVAERRKLDGLAPERADVILAGACIVAALLREFSADHLTVSERALRHGLFHDRFAAA